MPAETEFARLWQPNLSGIELFSAQLYRHAFAKHMHEAYTIGLNHGGLGGFFYRGGNHCAYPGSFNFIHPGEVHTGQVQGDQGWGFRNLYISVPKMQAVLAQLEWTSPGLPFFAIAPNTDVDAVGQAIFSRLFIALSRPALPLEQDSLLLELIAYLIDRYGDRQRRWQSSQPTSQAIAQAQTYLKAHYAKSISVETLAQRVGLSPYYLIRSFRQQVGLPPHSYQRHWQLVQAKRSLHTAQSIVDIAIAHGFYDQSHLNRAFKQAFGVTPGQYRQGNFVQDYDS
ncbi:AraC family transcriptional regulator [Phormidium tenue]|uniref:AraC family transcriptional regulator n=1 Tax=Phormidium tenue NIES-30 TaxID=549789 RepID=A0A1U7J0A1_9CYAN|nr:AraC family transcriptional regulator [Phormidium tenue]MBD2234282.1 AraC family transcriptional regulator [Phormidium tenue FACHB-1052]OKH45031.1 AraC family transcriptional regulator [Phormidium tenue NIES-30]